MDLGLIDIIALAIIALFGIIGFIRGVFKETISFIGIIIVVLLAYRYKNVVGDFLVLNLPFFNFDSFVKGSSVLNIVLYQGIGFIVISSLLFLLFKIILALTGLFEKMLRFTIVLGIPSKLLGIIVGLVEGYILAFIAVFFLSQPVFRYEKLFEGNKYAEKILNESPLLSKYAKNSVDTINDIYKLKDIKDANEVNLKALDILLDKKVTDVKIIEKLQDKGKIKITNIDAVLNKYR